MKEKKELSIIIMAAGKGTRMKSKLPKVLHKIAGKSMLDYVIDSVKDLNPEQILVIAGYEADTVIQSFDNRVPVTWVQQTEQLGTGHAIMQVIPHLKDYTGDVMILSGDVPLLSAATMKKLVEINNQFKGGTVILTTLLDDPFGYGRIIKDENNNIIKIVEEKDAAPEERSVREINSGTYCFDWQNLRNFLTKITPQNAQGEYYLTDVIKLFVDQGLPVKSYITPHIEEVLGVNDRATLAKMGKIIRGKINEELMLSGITIIDPETTYIDSGVLVGIDTVIYPNTIIEGKSVIGSNCRLGPNTHIVNSTIGDFNEISFSSVVDSTINNKCAIGPFSRIRERAYINDNCKIGNFVEIKKSNFEAGVKASHLAYLGDADIGAKTNIGAGTITCNYDGKHKHKTIIGSDVFVGSNSTLVAPLTLEPTTYIAAGSVITETVKTHALGVGRARQRNVENWVLRKKEKENENIGK
jgi:bifunctional UDP-N-acetylglucosamine pyrophosphorylase/glucosamine-1-phosphate N-acetyltransferase